MSNDEYQNRDFWDQPITSTKGYWITWTDPEGNTYTIRHNPLFDGPIEYYMNTKNYTVKQDT